MVSIPVVLAAVLALLLFAAGYVSGAAQARSRTLAAWLDSTRRRAHALEDEIVYERRRAWQGTPWERTEDEETEPWA